MRPSLLVLSLLSAASAAAVSVSAQSVTYDLKGSFSGQTGSTPFSAPGATFDLRFTVPAAALPTSSSDSQLTVAPTDFSFTLDNRAVSVSFSGLTFFPEEVAGQFRGGFSAQLVAGGLFFDLNVLGAHLYTGTPENPRFFGGTFGVDGDFFVTSDPASLKGAQALDVSGLTLVGRTVPPTATPEPSSLLALLALGGLAAGTAWHRRQGARRVPAVS